MEQLGATPHHHPPPPPHHLPPALATLRPATSFFCSWHGYDVDGAGARARPPRSAPPNSPGTGGDSTASPCCGGGTAAAVFPAPHQCRGWAHHLCSRVMRLRDLLAGAWNGLSHSHHQRADGPVWHPPTPREPV